MRILIFLIKREAALESELCRMKDSYDHEKTLLRSANERMTILKKDYKDVQTTLEKERWEKDKFLGEKKTLEASYQS